MRRRAVAAGRLVHGPAGYGLGCMRRYLPGVQEHDRGASLPVALAPRLALPIRQDKTPAPERLLRGILAGMSGEIIRGERRAAGAQTNSAPSVGIDPATGGVLVTLTGAGTTTTRTAVTSAGSGLVASKVLQASAGTHFSTAVTLDASAPSGTYYVQILDAASLPSNGNVTHIHNPIPIVHTSGTPDYSYGWNDEPGGMAFAAGCVVALSSTQFTLTVSGAYLMVDGAVS